METKTITWVVLVMVWVVLFVLNLKVYFFQRTIHKIHLKTSIPKNTFKELIPAPYLWMHIVSMFRWIVLIALFFFNWIAGLICLIAEFVLPLLLPEDDDFKNMKIMKEELKRKNDKSLLFLDKILDDCMKDG